MNKGYAINGRYELIAPLGEGGMANVYLAKDLILNRLVAVKIIRLDLSHDKNAVRRFQREALATTEMVHPNIVTIYDVGDENGLQYIVMEYVKGSDLKQYIKKNHPLSMPRVLEIMEQILSAVEEAHQHGIIHRDLKPQNILVNEDGQIKITDFGIAIAISENTLTQTNTMMGSVHYLSPEQARGSMATKQSDIYSLGIILYELLTGTVPFDGSSPLSIAIKHFKENVPSVREKVPYVPQSLDNVVLKATARDADERYQTVEAMAADLRTTLSPERADEPRFYPINIHENETTKVIPTHSGDVVVEDATGSTPPPNNSNGPSNDPDPKKKKKIKKYWWWLAGILALILLVVGLWVWQGSQEIKVPDVSEMTVDQAKSSLKTAKLNIGKTKYTTSNTIDKDHVIRTDPDKKMAVKANSDVDLIVSSGPQLEKFGNYHHKNYDRTKKMLTKAGYKIKAKYVHSDSEAKGAIISQSVKAGKKVAPKQTTVTFTVSKGKATFKMRDLSGYTQKSVQDYASEMGLSLTTSTAYSDTIQNGMVISQNPVANTPVSKGDSLSIVISKGKQPAQKTTFSKQISIPYEAPAASNSSSSDASSSSTNQENKIEIYIEDSTHSLNNVYKTLNISQNTTITLNFTVTNGKNAKYLITRDGETVDSDNNVTP